MKPGVYQMSFRGLTLAEAWRFGKKPLKFTIALLLKLIAFKGPKQWLPGHECETICGEAELSTGARQHLLPVAQRVKSLGYASGQFSVLSRNMDKHTKEGYSYLALHQDRMRSIFIGYISSDASGILRPTVAVTGSLASEEHADIEFVNHPNYMDGSSSSLKVRVSGKQIEDLDQAMLEFISRSRSPIKTFASLAAMKAHSIAMSEQAFDARIARGLYVYVGAG